MFVRTHDNVARDIGSRCSAHHVIHVSCACVFDLSSTLSLHSSLVSPIFYFILLIFHLIFYVHRFEEKSLVRCDFSSSLFKVIAESLWMVFDQKPNAVQSSAKWWQSTWAVAIPKRPRQPHKMKHMWSWHNRGCVWDKVATEWVGITVEIKKRCVTFAECEPVDHTQNKN